MSREVKARYTHGKLELLEELNLKEGDEVTIVVPEPASAAPKLRFGMRKGSITIKGDILAPLDEEWDALK